MIAGVFEVPASLLAWFYTFTTNYCVGDRADRRAW